MDRSLLLRTVFGYLTSHAAGSFGFLLVSEDCQHACHLCYIRVRLLLPAWLGAGASENENLGHSEGCNGSEASGEKKYGKKPLLLPPLETAINTTSRKSVYLHLHEQASRFL